MKLKIWLDIDFKKINDDFFGLIDTVFNRSCDYLEDEKKYYQKVKEFEKDVLKDWSYMRLWWIWGISFCLGLATIIIDDPRFNFLKSLILIFFAIFLISFVLAILKYKKLHKEYFKNHQND